MDLPQYTKSAKLGELGVSIVSKIVSDTFGWLFKRNHQEHDFGIDGQLEIITEKGGVTGQMLAVQIKCGESFLKEKDKWGFVYRGERKHFNYLANYPIPVIICLCDPDSETCYWVQFRPEATEPTDTGWKITVPFENNLDEAKAALESFAGPVHDALSELDQYWALNQLIVESSVVLYALDQDDVRAKNVAEPRAFFDRLRTTKKLASQCQGKVEFMFSGYDDDPRELYEIEEVREYVSTLDRALPELFFFIRTDHPAFSLKVFALCQTEVTWPNGRSAGDTTQQVAFDAGPVAEFVDRHSQPLNELTEWLGMPLEDEKRLFFSVIRALGFQVPPEVDGV